MINKLHSLYCCMLVLIVTFWSGIDTYATTVKMQQDQKVKGIVVDEKGEVIIGATIQDRKSTRLNSSHNVISRMPSSA